MVSARPKDLVDHYWVRLTLIAWVVIAAWFLHDRWAQMHFLSLPDTDDNMRLMQVRALLNGQGWYDLRQYRMNPPGGFNIHWSRIVDLPIAGLILLLRPLLGNDWAERIACIAVPLILSGALFAALVPAARRIGGPFLALVSAVLLALSLTILIQFQPLRIDHHNWQILMAAIVLGAAFDPRALRGGLVAALGTAIWLHVSSEGLPYAAMFGGLFALRYLRDAAAWPRLAAYLGGLAALSALVLLGTHGWAASLQTHCDAISPPFLIPMIAAALAVPLGRRTIGDTIPIRRCATLVIGGGCALAAFLLFGRDCLSGPFETLDPLVYRYWYLQVLEGRPIWEQSPAMAGMIVAGSLPGVIGALAAAWRAPDRAARIRWLELALLIVGSFAIALMVMRAMSVAHLFALPGAAWLVLALFGKAQRAASPLVRIPGSLAACLLTPIGLGCLWMAFIPATPADATKPQADCTSTRALAPLVGLPATTIFAPIDLGPDILQRTPHAVIGTAHHRNVAGIGLVIRGFMDAPATAKGVVGSTRATLLLLCPGAVEIANYAKVRPNGLAAQLLRGRAPDWLIPVPLPATSGYRLYRVRR